MLSPSTLTIADSEASPVPFKPCKAACTSRFDSVKELSHVENPYYDHLANHQHVIVASHDLLTEALTLSQIVTCFVLSIHIMHPWTRFPPELIDLIIDHLHDDRLALSACVLVCKAWTQAARYHLFNRPLIIDQWHWGTRKMLFQSSSVVSRIRDLWLTGNSDVANVEFWNSIPLSILTAQFQSLGTLRVHDIPWYQISSQARSSLLAPFSLVRVKTLHLSGISDHFMSYVVSALPSLVCLIGEISVPSWAVDLEPVTFRHRNPDTLRDIRLRNWSSSDTESRIHAVLERFLASDGLPAIRHVTLREIDMVDVQSINSFIAGLGPALQTFFCNTISGDIQCPAIDFSSNTSLGGVHFWVEPFYIQQIRWMTQTLSTVCSPAISWVTLVFSETTITADEGAGLRSIDQVLSRPIFSTLNVVEIYGPADATEISSYFAPHFPLCHARGILRFLDLEEDEAVESINQTHWYFPQHYFRL